MNGYTVKPLGVLLIGAVLLVTTYLVIRSLVRGWRLWGDGPPQFTSLG